MGKKVFSLFAILLLITVITAPAFSSEVSPWAKEMTYVNRTFAKLNFGLKNALFGWTELFTEPYDFRKAEENLIAGLGKGLVNAVADTTLGAVHAGTFLIRNDVALPDGGVDL